MLSAALHSTTLPRHTIRHCIQQHLIAHCQGASGLFYPFQHRQCHRQHISLAHCKAASGLTYFPQRHHKQHITTSLGLVQFRLSNQHKSVPASNPCQLVRSHCRYCRTLCHPPQQHRLSPAVMAGHSVHSMHSTASCRAYVGEATPAAGEYHSEDFDWEDLRQEAEALLAARSSQQQVMPAFPAFSF